MDVDLHRQAHSRGLVVVGKDGLQAAIFQSGDDALHERQIGVHHAQTVAVGATARRVETEERGADLVGLSERKRSITPREESAMTTAMVLSSPNSMASVNMPGIRNSYWN